MRSEQGTFGKYWGERKKGAGRKKDPRSGVPHLEREAVASRFPVHVTMKVRRGLPKLRRKACYRVIAGAFAKGCERAGRLENGCFRLVEYSVQNDHLHLIVEGKDRLSVSRGVQGLAIRIAKGLNRVWGRRGKVFGDRYHDRVLRTPREVRNALRYVLNNGRRHLEHFRGRPDAFSSGPWFDGWRDWRDDGRLGKGPVALARTWLLRVGWRRYGLLAIGEAPRAG